MSAHELQADIAELQESLRAMTLLASKLYSKLNAVAMAQLAGEAKAIAHDEQIAELQIRVAALEGDAA